MKANFGNWSFIIVYAGRCLQNVTFNAVIQVLKFLKPALTTRQFAITPAVNTKTLMYMGDTEYFEIKCQKKHCTTMANVLNACE